MIWKAIGQSVIGTSHVANGKDCEDANKYAIFESPDGHILACCASDGAGSAQFAGWASAYTTAQVIECAQRLVANNEEIDEAAVYAMLEDIYDGLEQEAAKQECELNEFSCTLLGAIITGTATAFFQVGDGAIVRNDGSDFYLPVWWPHNGEYQNTTSFLVDDRSFANVNVMILNELVTELAIFTDGLQMLALNTESQTAHQPFFTSMFRHLRMADTPEKVDLLNGKLADYLNSAAINKRTDDDKTLFLATKLQ
ncbi:MAG: PP2C family serine/threonine-protein phosphatase [Bacteroidota bacterium]